MLIHINRNGQQLGPYTLEQVNQYLTAGSLVPTDQAFTEGMPAWAPLETIPGVVIGANPAAPSPVPAMGATCPQCQVQVAPDALNCPSCGSSLQGVPAPSSGGKAKLAAIIGGGVLALGAIAAGLFFAFGNDSGNGNDPANSSGKDKQKPISAADFIKCKNNLSTIGRAYQTFSDDIDGGTPHLHGSFAGEVGNSFAIALGYQDLNDPFECKQWLNAYSLRLALNSYAALVSPLDKEAIAVMRRNPIKTFDHFKEATDITHNPKQMSYAIAMQGDLKCPETILALTRNVADADPASRQSYIRQFGGRNHPEFWKYPNEDRTWDKHGAPIAHLTGTGNKNYTTQFASPTDATHGIPAFKANQAHWLMSGGHVSGGDAAALNDQLRVAEDDFPLGDAISTGLNLILLRPTQ